MLLIGLTGSIGMGKSQTAQIFAEEGVPVYDADAAVHRLYAPGGRAVEPVAALFPETLRDGGIDRAILSTFVIDQPEALRELEKIVHPLVGQEQRSHLLSLAEKGHQQVVLDIPLLFEKQGASRVDVVVVVSAPPDLQRHRVMQRPNMSEEKFLDILSKQVPDAEKRAQADYVVDSSISVDDARRQVRDILQDLEGRPGRAFDMIYKAS